MTFFLITSFALTLAATDVRVSGSNKEEPYIYKTYLFKDKIRQLFKKPTDPSVSCLLDSDACAFSDNLPSCVLFLNKYVFVND